jgi:hypothetical protein
MMKEDEMLEGGGEGVVCERGYIYYMETENCNCSEIFNGSYISLVRFIHIVQSVKIARHV